MTYVAPILTGLSALFASSTLSAEVATSTIDSGDTAWVLVSTALVLLMTPGLALFYGGMVRTKNVVSTMFQNFAALSVVGLVWVIAGYSLAFSSSGSGLIGNLNWFMLNGVGQEANPDYSATIPHVLFMLFQCMFAIITPALITGAFAERVNFKSWLLFAGIWSLVVYAPVAHWVWGVGGWIRELGGLDFAGGLVVHITAGSSALVAAIVLGKRKDFGQESHPYDSSLVMIGTALLWFGWFGFNAGSALGANGLAAHAFAVTFVGAAAAALTWSLVDIYTKTKPTAIGFCIGAVAGLVTITPAAGFVSLSSAISFGLISGALCNFAAMTIKEKLKLDDTLDVFACHGLGGIIGSILTPIFASKAVNPAGADGLLAGNSAPLIANLAGTGAVIAYSMVATFVIIKAVGFLSVLRVNSNEESNGLDQSQHGEVINANFYKASTHENKSSPSFLKAS